MREAAKPALEKLDELGIKYYYYEHPLAKTMEDCEGIGAGVVSGAVTPLALMNDKEHKTLLVVDKDILRDEMVCCHPLTSDATVAMHRYDLIKFVRACGNEIKFLDIGDGEHTEE